jgi:hypothetical protein
MRIDILTLLSSSGDPILQPARDRQPVLPPAFASRAFTSRVLTAIVILAASLCVIAPGSYREPNLYDEGISLYGAERILAGELPYRDFWTIYLPADLYLIAGLFKLFGVRLIVERHAWVLLESILGLLVYAIARRLTGRVWAAFCWGLAVVWLTRVPLFGSAMTPAMVCCFGALLATLVFLEGDRRSARPIAAAGLLVGLCALFRQDVGIYAFLAIAATLALARAWPADAASAASDASGTSGAAGAFAASAASAAPGALGAHKGFLPLVVFALAAALPVAPAALALFALVPRSALVEHLIAFPLDTYAQTRAMPMPPWPASPLVVLRGDLTAFAYLKATAVGWQLYASSAVLLFAWIWSLFSIVRGRPRDSWLPHATFLVSCTGLLMLNHARVRPDVFHLYPAFLFALIVGAGALAATSRWRARWTRMALIGAAAVGMSGVALLTWRTEQVIRQRQSPFVTERTAGMSTPRASHAYERLVAYVQQTVPANAPIFVGNNHHDAIKINDALFYFVSARRSATPYHDLHPGVATTERVQASIIRDLERQQVTCIVLRDEAPVVPIPGMDIGPPPPPGSTMLDRYIAANFVAGPRFDEYQVWERAPRASR